MSGSLQWALRLYTDHHIQKANKPWIWILASVTYVFLYLIGTFSTRNCMVAYDCHTPVWEASTTEITGHSLVPQNWNSKAHCLWNPHLPTDRQSLMGTRVVIICAGKRPVRPIITEAPEHISEACPLEAPSLSLLHPTVPSLPTPREEPLETNVLPQWAACLTTSNLGWHFCPGLKSAVPFVIFLFLG